MATSSSLKGLSGRKRQRRLPIIPILSFLLMMGGAGMFTMELVRFSQQADQLANNIVVGGIPVGGLSAGEAISRWEQAYAEPIILYYADSPIIFDPAAVGFRTNSEVMFAAAQSAIETQANFWARFTNYLTGQQGIDTVSVPIDADYQANLLEQYMRDIAQRYDRPAGTASYDVQTLTFRPGAEGYILDVDKAVELVEAALLDPTKRTIVLPISGSDSSRPSMSSLRSMIIDYLDSQGFIHDGQTTIASVYIMDLETGEELTILSDVAFSAASTIKMSILVDYYRHLLFEPTQEEAWLMANSLLCSNNSSSNLLMQITGERITGVEDNLFAGIGSVIETDQQLGARNTYINAPLVIGIEGETFGSITAPVTSPNSLYNTGADPFNQTTTEDLGTIFNMVYDCAEYGSGLMAAFPEGDFTQQECRQMLELTSANDLQRLLQGGLPPGTRFSHKNGWIDNEHGDAGIVYPANGRNYIIAVFLWEDVEFLSYDRAWPIMEGISRAAWNYFSPEAPLVAPRSDLPPTAMECEGNYLPPDAASVNLNDINGWRRSTMQSQAPSQSIVPQNNAVPTPLPLGS